MCDSQSACGHALFLPSFSASSSRNDTRMESMAVSYTPMIWIAIFNAKIAVMSSGNCSHRLMRAANCHSVARVVRGESTHDGDGARQGILRRIRVDEGDAQHRDVDAGARHAQLAHLLKQRQRSLPLLAFLTGRDGCVEADHAARHAHLGHLIQQRQSSSDGSARSHCLPFSQADMTPLKMITLRVTIILRISSQRAATVLAPTAYPSRRPGWPR